MSWIPSEAVRGATRVAFDAGFTHYDDPPPDVIEDLEALRKADRFRFANLLSAWMEVDGKGKVTGYGYSGGGQMGSTTAGVARFKREFEAVALPDLQLDPEVGDGQVRSPRRPEDGPGCPPRVGCGVAPSSSGRRRWSGRP